MPTTRPEYLYKRGHRPKACEGCGVDLTGTSHHKKLCDTCQRPYCACGCGERVRYPHFKYLIGHHQLGKRKRKTLTQTCTDCGKQFKTANGTRPQSRCTACLKPKKCACGCGRKTATPGARFVVGHCRKGTRYSKAYRSRIKEALNRPEVLAKLSRNHKHQHIRQNKLEARMMLLLDGRVWKFVGSSRLVDGTKNKHFHLRQQLPISGDFVSLKHRTLIMVDGCYWHECPKHGSRRMEQVPERDRKKGLYAEAQGWSVLRVWEHDILQSPDAVQEAVSHYLESRGSNDEQKP